MMQTILVIINNAVHSVQKSLTIIPLKCPFFVFPFPLDWTQYYRGLAQVASLGKLNAEGNAWSASL